MSHLFVANKQVVFVYGTLRPGFGNYDLLQPAVRAVVAADTTTEGQLFHVRGSADDYPIFPVAKLGRKGRITGTLLVVDTDVWVWDVVRRMELDAGYEERTVRVADESVQVRTHGEPGGRPYEVEALAFHYPHAVTGLLIPSGDWADVVAKDSWK